MTAPIPAPVSPPVVEIVARFRGRVVDVQHVRWSEPPAVAPAAWLTGGAVALLLGAALFAQSLSEVAAATSCAAPPCPAPPTTAAGLGALLVALAVVPLTLAFVRWRDRPRTSYTIGESPAADLTVPLRDDVPLVIALEDNVVLGLPPGVGGTLAGLDLGEAAAQGRRSIALQDGATARLELGELTFEVARVAAERPERARWHIDRLVALSHAAAAVVLGGWFLSLEPSEPGDLEAVHSEQLARVTRYLTAIPSAPVPTPPPEVLPVRSYPASPRPASRPAAPPPPETSDPLTVAVDTSTGLASPSSPAVFTRKRSNGLRRMDSDYDFDRVAGFLDDEGFNNAVDDYTVAMRVGQRHYADTPEDRKFWADATGGPPRTAKHFGGLELAETERGGGVHDDKPRPPPKPANMVTLASTTKPPPPTAEEMKKLRRLVTLQINPPTLAPDSGIDPGAFHAYARKHAAQLRACYEDGLDGDADLDGVMQVTVRFAPNGRLEYARIDWSTLNIGKVGDCVLANMRRWKFKPQLDRSSAAVFRLDFSVRNR